MGKTKQMKIGIYSPYLSTLGGGERYLLDIACGLSRNHDVFLFASSSLKSKIQSLLRLDIGKVNFSPESIIKNKNLLKKYILLFGYDIFIFMTDGSIPFSLAKKNIMIIQSPVHIPKPTIINQFKLLRWNIICYSNFMKQIIKKRLGREAKILSPSIDIDQFMNKNVKKKNIILSVGRFFPYPHNKKHDVLIDIFKENYKQHFYGWKLIIVGGLTEEGGKKIFNNLKTKVGTYPIEIMANIPFVQLVRLYQEAKIYWHATGYGEDVIRYPERTEHFGITTLEAMAAGEVPLVFAAGGQMDIISDGYNGYLWNSKEELVKKTCQLIVDDDLFKRVSRNALYSVKKYSHEKFYAQLEENIIK